MMRSSFHRWSTTNSFDPSSDYLRLDYQTSLISFITKINQKSLKTFASTPNMIIWRRFCLNQLDRMNLYTKYKEIALPDFSAALNCSRYTRTDYPSVYRQKSSNTAHFNDMSLVSILSYLASSKSIQFVRNKTSRMMYKEVFEPLFPYSVSAAVLPSEKSLILS